MSNPAIHQLEALLPLACEWATAEEQMILQAGAGLNSEMLAIARKIGIAQPERVRVLQVAELPNPKNPQLCRAGQIVGLFSKRSRARTVGYGIMIHSESWGNRNILVHELAHTMQYERLGGIEAFLQQYMDELKTVGYLNSPLEGEAARLAREVGESNPELHQAEALLPLACEKETTRPAQEENVPIDVSPGWFTRNDVRFEDGLPIDVARGWFTTPLRRDERLHTRPEWDATALQGDKCAQVFTGIIHHDDSVEIVVGRNCDDDRAKGHETYWPGVWHRRWRWSKSRGFYSWQDEFNAEEMDRIEQLIQRRFNALTLGAENEPLPYNGYAGIPWKNAGASRSGVSCSGLVWLWINEQTDFHPTAPTLPAGVEIESKNMPEFKQSNFEKGDVVFFRHKATGKIMHVAVCIADNRYLHIVQGCGSRVETGFRMLDRLGYSMVGALSPIQAQAFYQAIAAEYQERQNAAQAGVEGSQGAAVSPTQAQAFYQDIANEQREFLNAAT